MEAAGGPSRLDIGTPVGGGVGLRKLMVAAMGSRGSRYTSFFIVFGIYHLEARTLRLIRPIFTGINGVHVYLRYSSSSPLLRELV
jgi:hypothetical protein